MSTIEDNLTEGIAARVSKEREARKWSLADLANHSEFSKAMISKIKRGESSLTTRCAGSLVWRVWPYAFDLPDPS